MSDYAALKALLEIKYPCEICKKVVMNDHELVTLYLDHLNSGKNVYAHEECIQINCDQCGRGIADLGQAYRICPVFPKKGIVTFRHPKCQ